MLVVFLGFMVAFFVVLVGDDVAVFVSLGLFAVFKGSLPDISVIQ